MQTATPTRYDALWPGRQAEHPLRVGQQDEQQQVGRDGHDVHDQIHQRRRAGVLQRVEGAQLQLIGAERDQPDREHRQQLTDQPGLRDRYPAVREDHGGDGPPQHR